MDQFGVHMHFLWIIQILWIVFILETHFLIHFLDFITLWIGPQFQKTAGALAQMQPRHRKPTRWTTGSIINNYRGSLVKWPSRRSTGQIWSLDLARAAQIRSHRAWDNRQCEPHDSRSTFQIQNPKINFRLSDLNRTALISPTWIDAPGVIWSAERSSNG
jgi:hypothetical protein